jgi:hypothetical protein
MKNELTERLKVKIIKYLTEQKETDKGKNTDNGKNREKFVLNSYETWLDRDKLKIYPYRDSEEEDGISIYSNHLTKQEKRQIKRFIEFGD